MITQEDIKLIGRDELSEDVIGFDFVLLAVPAYKDQEKKEGGLLNAVLQGAVYVKNQDIKKVADIDSCQSIAELRLYQGVAKGLLEKYAELW